MLAFVLFFVLLGVTLNLPAVAATVADDVDVRVASSALVITSCPICPAVVCPAVVLPPWPVCPACPACVCPGCPSCPGCPACPAYPEPKAVTIPVAPAETPAKPETVTVTVTESCPTLPTFPTYSSPHQGRVTVVLEIPQLRDLGNAIVDGFSNLANATIEAAKPNWPEEWHSYIAIAALVCGAIYYSWLMWYKLWREIPAIRFRGGNPIPPAGIAPASNPPNGNPLGGDDADENPPAGNPPAGNAAAGNLPGALHRRGAVRGRGRGEHSIL